MKKRAIHVVTVNSHIQVHLKQKVVDLEQVLHGVSKHDISMNLATVHIQSVTFYNK